MTLSIDSFNDLMGNVDKLVDQISTAQAKMINTQHRAMFEQVLAKIREARQQAQVDVPAAINALDGRRKNVKERIQKLREDIPRRKARRAEMVKNAKAVRARREEAKKKLKMPPVKADLKKVKMPPAWGDQLKDELLHKFGNLPSAPVSVPRDAAIWDDWQWNSTDKPLGEG